jgi:putative membrane protein insertion efficiency factor
MPHLKNYLKPLEKHPPNNILKTVGRILSLPFIVLVKLYQWIISPWLGPKCRYIPTCSEYAIESFKKYGPIKGLWLTIKRVSSCHPWGGHGHDPVP